MSTSISGVAKQLAQAKMAFWEKVMMIMAKEERQKEISWFCSFGLGLDTYVVGWVCMAAK